MTDSDYNKKTKIKCEDIRFQKLTRSFASNVNYYNSSYNDNNIGCCYDF